jgi:hypothetical protein
MKLGGVDMTKDFRAVDAVECPDTTRITVHEVMSYFELWLDDRVLRSIALSLEDSEALRARIPRDAWETVADPTVP